MKKSEPAEKKKTARKKKTSISAGGQDSAKE
jgi:hypothetical protein